MELESTTSSMARTRSDQLSYWRIKDEMRFEDSYPHYHQLEMRTWRPNPHSAWWTSGLTRRMAFYQGAALALKLGAPIQVRLDPILHYWVGLTFPVMELPKHVEIVYCVHMSKNNYVQLYEIGCPGASWTHMFWFKARHNDRYITGQLNHFPKSFCCF